MTDRDERRTAARMLAVGLAALMALTVCLAFTPRASAADRPPGIVHVGGDAVPAVADLGPTSFTHLGPYGVGERRMALPTNGAPVQVWYPARKADVRGKPIAQYDMVDWLPDFLKNAIPSSFTLRYPSGGVRGVPVAHGRFPIVVFSHGFGGFRDQSSFLTAWLASWGFVVAAPDHFSRDLTRLLGGPAPDPATTDVQDLRATLTLITTKGASRSSRFHGHLDTSRVAAVGHSAGGAASEAWAATDRRVTTFVGLAGATVGAFGETHHGPGSIVPRRSGLFMAATSDKVVPLGQMRSAYRALHRPKRLVLVGGGHHAFSDICEIGASSGGLLAVAALLHIQVSPQLALLASDGCSAPDLPPTQAWPAIRQVTVAQLRHVFGFDRSAAGLTGLVSAFPGVVSDSRSSG